MGSNDIVHVHVCDQQQLECSIDVTGLFLWGGGGMTKLNIGSVVLLYSLAILTQI